MKKIILLIAISLLIISCPKKDEDQYKDVSGEIIYTDSFSPEEWENPASRIKIEAIDKDIGELIKDDVMDPNSRDILNLVKNFIVYMAAKNNTEIEKICTPSAFNSYNLRIPDIIFNKNYSIRVAYPTSSNQSLETQDNNNLVNDKIINKKNQNPVNKTPIDLGKDPIWINFKLVILTKSILGKIEIQNINKKWIITDFDTKFFEDMESILKK